MPDQDLEQFPACLDRADVPQFCGSSGEVAGGAEETGPDDAGVAPRIRVGFDHGHRFLDPPETGKSEGLPAVLELLMAAPLAGPAGPWSRHSAGCVSSAGDPP
ncbi:hypothetical protein ACFY8W_23550 [Streptomyces sp. NPDC012637]|uniref:hypothetical protein n=1 Tax=Streptomyces sp. NPDC012637 TaxID=3364842 RepID=UPI0036E1FEF5